MPVPAHSPPGASDRREPRSNPGDEPPRRAVASRLRALWVGRPGLVLRVVVAVLPFVVLARSVRWGDVFARARDVGAWSVASAFAIVLLSSVVGAMRWSTMLRAYGVAEPPPVATLARHYLVGIYFNLLPSGIAGDAVRAHRIRRVMPDMTAALTVVFLERVAGLFGLCIVAAAAMASGAEGGGGVASQLLELGLLGALALSLGLLAAPWALARWPGLRTIIARLPALGGVALRLPLARSPARLALAVALSVVTQGLTVLAITRVVLPLAPGLSLLTCARVVPGIILTTYIPLTPGGLGQRELAFQYMLAPVGVPAPAAIAASLLTFGVALCVAGVGGLCLLGERALGRGPEDA